MRSAAKSEVTVEPPRFGLRWWIDSTTTFLVYIWITSFCALFFPLRFSGGRSIPAAGGVLILANHLSYLDPPLAGTALPRWLRYVARDSLFSIPVVGFLIRAIGGFPIRRDGVGKEGLRRMQKAMAAGLP
ncbi:MAG: lysophospholipid acyltransferase family protein, partial [Planctomycetia bacterium]